MNLLGRCSQEDFFKLDHAALPNDIFIWQAVRSNSYQPLDIFLVIYLSRRQQGVSIYF